VNAAISATEIEDKWGDPYGGWEALYNNNVGFSRDIDFDGEPVTVTVVAKAEESENAGYGEAVWVVVQVGDQFFKKAGYTSSYDSDQFDGACVEVSPREKTVIVYE
jgi:hypothetical protein